LARTHFGPETRSGQDATFELEEGTMNSALSEATARLTIQAQGTENANDSANLADYVRMLRHETTSCGAGQVWAKLLPDFEILNTELNAGSSAFCADRSLLYAVNGLVVQCCDFAATRQNTDDRVRQILELQWRISTAWDAVLSGDIDSICVHVDQERAVRTNAD
jgi:hypothetical protein